MTWRGALLVAAAFSLVAAGAGVPVLVPVGAVAAVLALAAVVIDSRLAVGAADLRASRDVDELLSVGAPHTVAVNVDDQGRRSWARVRDEYPPQLTATRAVASGRLPLQLRYSVTATSRGEVRFERIVVRADGPLRLGFRQTALDRTQAIGVDADLSAVSRYQALARRGMLQELGVRTLRLRTEGTEFERIREAVPDDSLRMINWKATARTGRLMAVELMPERAQPVIVCLDCGRLMGVGAGRLTKLDLAVNAALLLVHVALSSGDRVGAFAFSERVRARLAPRSGRAQMRRFLDTVRPLEPDETEPDYAEVMALLERWQTRRALLAIFTDFVDPGQSQALVEACLRLRRRHLPLVITVRDPAVVDLAAARPANSTAAYSRVVASGLLAERETVVRRLRASGVETIDSDVRSLSPRVVNRYLELKRRLRI